MKKRSMIVALCGALALNLLSSCVAVVGNRVPEGGGTAGQQLIDLKKARDTGAITEEEYQSQRAKVLNHK